MGSPSPARPRWLSSRFTGALASALVASCAGGSGPTKPSGPPLPTSAQAGLAARPRARFLPPTDGQRRLDALIDAYFPIVEHYGERIDQLEEQVVEHASDGLVRQIHGLRRAVMELRRALWPLREVLNTLMREGTPYIEPETRVFLRDCSDHVSQLLDMIEIDREVTSTLLDLHLSSLSTRMNEIMSVLTIIATIFIPIGFVASVYGMNFDPSVSPWNMPELHWRYGYPYALLVMAAMACGMLAFFWAKGWIGRRRRGGRAAERDRGHGL